MEVGEGEREMKERVWGGGGGGLKFPHYRIDYEVHTKDPKAPEVQDGSLMQNYV